MDRFTTNFVVSKDEQGKVIGFQITAAGTTEDEHFCMMLPKNLHEGKAGITVSNRKLFIESIGIGGKEKWGFKLLENEELQFQRIISGLGKNYHGNCKIRGGSGVSFMATFEKIVPLNKREQGKRKRSIWRNPIPPKDHTKIFNWERIFT